MFDLFVIQTHDSGLGIPAQGKKPHGRPERFSGTKPGAVRTLVVDLNFPFRYGGTNIRTPPHSDGLHAQRRHFLKRVTLPDLLLLEAVRFLPELREHWQSNGALISTLPEIALLASSDASAESRGSISAIVAESLLQNQKVTRRMLEHLITFRDGLNLEKRFLLEERWITFDEPDGKKFLDITKASGVQIEQEIKQRFPGRRTDRRAVNRAITEIEQIANDCYIARVAAYMQGLRYRLAGVMATEDHLVPRLWARRVHCSIAMLSCENRWSEEYSSNDRHLVALLGMLNEASTSLTVLYGGTDEQRSLIVRALGRASRIVFGTSPDVAGICNYEPRDEDAQPGILYLRHHEDLSSVERLWPRLMETFNFSPAPLWIFDNVFKSLPSRVHDIVDFARGHRVIIGTDTLEDLKTKKPNANTIFILPRETSRTSTRIRVNIK